jgi:hypothetical protein
MPPMAFELQAEAPTVVPGRHDDSRLEAQASPTAVQNICDRARGGRAPSPGIPVDKEDGSKVPSIQVGRQLDDQFPKVEDPPMEAESGGSDDSPNPSSASPTFECSFNSPSQPLFPLSGDGGDEE